MNSTDHCHGGPHRDQAELRHHDGPNRHRVLHVIIPEDAFVQAHLAAVKSGMYFKDFITEVLRSSVPIKAASTFTTTIPTEPDPGQPHR